MSKRHRYTGKARLVEDDDFEHARKIQKLGEATGGIPPRPSKTLPFVGSAVRNVGFSALLTASMKARAIAMNAPDEESSVVSLSLDAFGAAAFGYVNFGAGGVFSEFEVDIGRGTSFDLPGSMVEVDVLNESATTTALVKAFAGWMPSGAHPSSRPIRTLARTVGYIQSGYQNPIIAGQSLSAVGAGVTRIIVPPNFAKDVLIQRYPSATCPMTVQMRDETGVIIFDEVVYGAGAAMETPIELTNDCKLISVQNNGAVACTFRAIFGLGI